MVNFLYIYNFFNSDKPSLMYTSLNLDVDLRSRAQNNTFITSRVNCPIIYTVASNILNAKDNFNGPYFISIPFLNVVSWKTLTNV